MVVGFWTHFILNCENIILVSHKLIAKKMKGKNILHLVLFKRILAFLGISSSAICVPYIICLLQKKGNGIHWLWCGAVYLLFLINAFLCVWVIAENHFPLVRSCKHVINAVTCGAAIGFSLQRCAAWGLFSASDASMVCATSAVLTLLLLGSDVETCMCRQLSPCPAAPPLAFSRLLSFRGDIGRALHVVLISSVLSAAFACFAGTTSWFEGIVCAAKVSLGVCVGKLSLESALVGIVLHPVHFEKLRPLALLPLSGGDNSAGYMYAVQNFNLVFLLNNISTSLGLPGISYSDVLASLDSDSSSPVLNHHVIAAKQNKFVDELYLSSVAVFHGGACGRGAASRSWGLLASAALSPPRPALTCSASPGSSSCGGAGVLQATCRSLALLDVCRLARVSPPRRALIYRSPVLLQHTMTALCSLIDCYTVQVHLCAAWLVVEEGNSGVSTQLLSAGSGIGQICRTAFSFCSGIKTQVSSAPLPGLQTGADRAEQVCGSSAPPGAVGESHAGRAVDALRTMRRLRESSAGASAAAAVLGSLSSLLVPGAGGAARATRKRWGRVAPVPLSRVEVLDAVNAAEALSLLLMKSLKEDTTGQTYIFFPSALSSLLNMSIAIGTYLDASRADGSFKASSSLKLSRASKWSPDFDCGEIQLLQLAAQEAVVRVSRSGVQVVQAMCSSSNSAMVLSPTLSDELIRITSSQLGGSK